MINTITLEKFKFIAQQVIGNYAFLDNVQISERQRDMMLEGMVYTLKAEIFGEHLKRAEVTHPATWKDAVKERLYIWLGSGWEPPGHWPWFGDYCRKRWPVEYRTIQIDVRALYPNISMPHAPHALHVVREEDRHIGRGWFDMAKTSKPLWDIVQDCGYQARDVRSLAMGRAAYYEVIKAMPLEMSPFSTYGNAPQIFGCPIKIDATLPDDVIEFRDRDGSIVGKIYNIGVKR